ncbi:hypothetical protein QQS21_002059 [Conoideocrella luteorostrata]|uniref:Uncharacterized protein n=1 Tax=Conoideocrella luteorostrata TaxID=1105319 RepID=A0AAJ0FXP0_9HYPO|nr:hypothetical protein QQS21_002059 [Conoideocrella luteorostrata]
MSSPEAAAPAAATTVREVLALDEDQLIKFMNDCRTSKGFDVSRVTDLRFVPAGLRDQLAEKLIVTMDKACPLDTDELSSRLDALADDDGPCERTQGEDVESPTGNQWPSFPERYNRRFKDSCYSQLVGAGGRPAMSLEHLQHTPTSKEAPASQETLRAWLDNTDSAIPDGDGDLLAESFQQNWQWDNRGKYAGDEGFTAFLASQRWRWRRRGGFNLEFDPSEEKTAKETWEQKERHLELSGREGLAAYGQAVKRRLASHQFTQPFQLAEDPRQQDPWTTWVEYLGYVYWCEDRAQAEMQAEEPRFLQALKDAQRFRKVLLSAIFKTTMVPGVDTSYLHMNKFIERTQIFRRRVAAVHRFAERAKWVLGELSLIDDAPSAKTNRPGAIRVQTAARREGREAMTMLFS